MDIKTIKTFPQLMIELSVQRESNNVILVVTKDPNSYRSVVLNLAVQSGRDVFRNIEDEKEFKSELINSFLKYQSMEKKEHKKLIDITNQNGFGIYLFRYSISYLVFPYSENMPNEEIDEINRILNPMGRFLFKTDTLFYLDDTTREDLMEHRKNKIFECFCGN